MFQQTAQVRVMHGLRRGRPLVLLSDPWIPDDGLRQFLQPRILDRFGVSMQACVELLDVFLGVRQIIRQRNFFRFGPANLLHGELQTVAVSVHARLHFDDVVARDVPGGGLELIPHARFHGAALVAELEPQIGFAFARIAKLFFSHQEKAGNVGVGGEVADEYRLHLDSDRLPNRRNFLWPFFFLSASGVALTSWISLLPTPAMSANSGLMIT